MTPRSALQVAHFSDLHYGPRNLAEADRCFGAAIERAVEIGADVAVISGDSTDHALDLHSPSAVALVSRVRRLADHCPVLMLQGTWSHEPPGTLPVFRELGGRHAVHVADRIGQVGLTTAGDWVVSPGWGFDALPEGLVALFSCLPSVNRAAVAAALGAADAAGATGEHVATLLRGLAPSHAMARQLGLPTLLVSHGTVFGCITEHGVPMAGFDHEFTTGSLFDAGAQAVLLGHIHRHQCWERDDGIGRRCIAYAGSIGRFHHGEAGDKGFLLWQVGPDSAACRLEAAPARRTVDICFDGKPDLAALRGALAAQPVEGAWECSRGRAQRHRPCRDARTAGRCRGRAIRRTHLAGGTCAFRRHRPGRHDAGQGGGLGWRGRRATRTDRTRMFMAMKREVLKLGGYEREFFVSQTPELTAMVDAVIDLDAMHVNVRPQRPAVACFDTLAGECADPPHSRPDQRPQ